MTEIADALEPVVESGAVPGLVAAVAVGDDVETTVLGHQEVGGAPMQAGSIFRITSAGKPITAAAVLALVADGLLALDEPVAELLPELSAPSVLREPTSSLDDVVPLARPITTIDLLRSTNGLGFPADQSAPIAQALVERLQQGPPRPATFPPPGRWMAEVGRLPLVHQPGAGFAYNTAYDILGVLVERASGRPFPAFLEERILGPLGMQDTAFSVPARDLGRLTALYRRGDDGLLELVDEPSGQWSSPLAFGSGAGGLVSTAADLLAFHRMLLARGGDILPASLVEAMTSDQLDPAVRASNPMFLDDQSWGFGGGVDIVASAPWHVPGRYGWVGGSGTSAYHVPGDGSIAVLLTQVELNEPGDVAVLERFWAAVAERLGHGI